jgi:hypothetical protein
MGEAIKGVYNGEGANVTGSLKQAALTPNIPARVVVNNPTNPTGAKEVSQIPIDIYGRLRTSSEPARDGTAISVGGGDQTLTQGSRSVYVGTAGNLVCRLVDSTADVTFTGLLAGQVYPFAIAIVRQTGTTAAGVLLY